jgi:hypothetical protein
MKKAETIIKVNSIPEETSIYYSKRNAIYRLIVPVIMLGLGILVLCFEDFGNDKAGIVAVSVFSLFATFLIFYDLKIYFNNKPQIILNNKGIQLSGIVFYKWSEIIDAKVIGKIERGMVHYFVVEYPAGKRKIRIKTLNIDPTDLIILLNSYQKRSGEVIG